MNRLRALLVGVFGTVGTLTSVSAATLVFTGFVGTVGGNLGTSIDGSFPSFADRDAYTITLTYNPAQAPRYTSQGGGTNNSADYYLLETNITIHADDGPLTWTYSTPAANNVSHSFTVQNDVFGQDSFSAGLSGATFSGPTLGPSLKSFSHWNLNFYDWEGTVFSDTSIPTFSDLPAFNSRASNLVFVGYTSDDTITLSAPTPVTAVPEPSTFALIIGVTSLAAIAALRRRRRA